MHEYAITTSIIDIVKKTLEKKKYDKVINIDFEIKRLSHIEPESIRFYYSFLTKDDKRLAGAELKFKQTDMHIKCLECGKETEIEDIKLRCRYCGSTSVKMLEEDDLKIISLDVQ